MRTLICAFLIALVLPVSAFAESPLVKKLSAHSVQETMNNLEALVAQKGLLVFARIDHAGAAKDAGESLPPTELLIFGSPKVGTLLMQEERSVGIELPLKVLAWQGDDGRVWLAYEDPKALAAPYGLEQKQELLGKMLNLVKGLVSAAASP